VDLNETWKCKLVSLIFSTGKFCLLCGFWPDHAVKQLRWKQPYSTVHPDQTAGNKWITEWFGLERTFRGHLAQPPAVSRDIFNYIMLLRAPSNLALKIQGTEGTRITAANYRA